MGWFSKAVYPTTAPREDYCAGVVYDQKLHGFGGLLIGSSTRRREVYSYDNLTNAWTSRAVYPLTGGIQNARAVAVPDGVHLLGGESSSGSGFSYHYKYDPVANTWATKANLPYTHLGSGTSVAAYKDGFIYVLGTPGDTANVCYKYVIATDTWLSIAAPTQKYGFRTANAVLASDGKFYMFGDFQLGPGVPFVTTECRVYDPTLDSWATGPALPASRQGHHAFAFEGVILIAGGKASNGTLILDVLEFNVATQTYTTAPPLPLGMSAGVGGISSSGMHIVQSNTSHYVGTIGPIPGSGTAIGSGYMDNLIKGSGTAIGQGIVLEAQPAAILPSPPMAIGHVVV